MKKGLYVLFACVVALSLLGVPAFAADNSVGSTPIGNGGTLGGFTTTPMAAPAPVPAPMPAVTELAQIPPPDVMPVVFMRGTPYEMGYQYGQQADDYIKIVMSYSWSFLLSQYNDKAAVKEALKQYEGYIKDETPELIDMMRGMAHGAGVTYADILMINSWIDLAWFRPVSSCTTISAWGSATKDGKVIGGSNLDGVFESWSYQVTVVGYPSEGNSYITTATAGMIGTNFFLNDKGLITIDSAGEAARPEDVAYGVPSFCIGPHIAMCCDNAEEAKLFVLGVSNTGGACRQFVDVNGDAYATESTAALTEVREPGDFGEEDYLVTANHFIIPEMEAAKRPGAYWSSIYRYLTAEKYLQEGNLDVSAFMNILGEGERYWDGSTWVSAEWSTNTLDRRSSRSGTISRRIGVPEDKTVYILTGGASDKWGNGAPFLTAQFVKLVLEDSPASVTATAKQSAQQELWLASKALADSTSPTLSDRLNEAKTIFWEGLFYQAEAGLAKDENTALEFYGKAATCFCKAQAYALQVIHGEA